MQPRFPLKGISIQMTTGIGWTLSTKTRFPNEVGLFTMSNGATMQICEFRRIGHPGCERPSGIYGTEGSYEQSLAGSVWADKQGRQNIQPTQMHEYLPNTLKDKLGGHGGSHAYLVHEFVDSVNQQRLPRVNVWEAVPVLCTGNCGTRISNARWRITTNS